MTSHSVMTWDEYFMEMCAVVARKSKDCGKHVGSVIVGPGHEIRSTGYNGFPRGVDDSISTRHERPSKYMWTEHAERNSIYNAARNGVSLEGSTIYSSLYPCMKCMRGIVQAGIVEVVAPAPDSESTEMYKRYETEFTYCREMLNETGVIYREFGENSGHN